jgi:hypothetical protein
MSVSADIWHLWQIYSDVPCQSANKDALLATASIAAVLWTGGVIAIQLTPDRARAKAVLGMEYLQFAFFSPAVALVAEPIALRIIATVSAAVIFAIGVTHLLRGAKARYLARLAGLAVEESQIGVIVRNLIYYGRWTTASTVGAILIAILPTQTTVAWVALVVGFIGLQSVLRFLNVDED